MSTGSAIRKRSRSMTDVAFRERASESAAVAAMEPAKRRNISLDVDLDSDSGTAYTSASQYSGETNVEHLPELADFVKAVAEGVSRVVFPRPQRPYATVHALMISWEEDDLRTEHEISNLRKTFEKTYGYTTNHYKIPSSDSPEFDLDLVLSQTNYHHGRNKDGLLIIYYGGHGELEKRTSHAIWKAWLDSTSAPRSPRSPQLNWSDVQSTAMKAKGDILFILDCCYASGALRTAHNPYRGHTTRRELLLASGNEKASTQNSLTKAIICELDELRGSPCTISSLHSSLLQNQPEHGLKPTPIFTCMAGASAGISLVPLPDPATSAHPDGQSMITPKADLAQLTSECRVLISVALVELGGPSMYKAWVEWFRDHAPPNVAGISIEQIIKPEAVHKGNSYHMVFSIPVSVWNSMTPHPAINFVSFIRSGNLISAENSDLSGDHGAIQLRLRELLGTSSYTDLNQMLRQENETLRARIKVLETAPDSNTALDKEEKLHIPLRPKDALHDAETPDQSDAEVPPTLKDSTLGDNPRTALLVPDSSRPERRVRPKHPIAPSSPKGDPPVLSHGSKSGDDHVKSKDAPKETIGALVGGTTLLERMMGRRSKAMGKARDQSGPTTRHGPVQSLSSSTTPDNQIKTFTEVRGLELVWPRDCDEYEGPPEGPFAVDFIAIHGITGNMWETWKHEDGTLWLRDLLPIELPGSRVWTYGYLADVFGGIHRGTLRDTARDLLREIGVHTRVAPRPIIFICHSLGGIVAKQAIIDAPEIAQELSPRLGGVMFFSTPRRGSKTGDLATVLTGIVNVAAESGSLGLAKYHLEQNILKELNTWPQSLRDLHDHFCRATLEAELIVKSVCETKATVIGGKSFGVVVDGISGSTGLSQEHLFAAPRDHIAICRFSKDEAFWLEISRHLRAMAQACQQSNNPASIQGKGIGLFG